MVDFQAKVSRYVTEQKQYVDNFTLQAQRTIEDDKENLLQAKQGLTAVAEADDSLHQRIRDEERQLDELRKELEGLTSQACARIGAPSMRA